MYYVWRIVLNMLIQCHSVTVKLGLHCDYVSDCSSIYMPNSTSCQLALFLDRHSSFIRVVSEWVVVERPAKCVCGILIHPTYEKMHLHVSNFRVGTEK
jgi:hypothetical protein